MQRNGRNRYNRPGITAVLAMMYMTLFATLAIGFYASVTTAVQVAGNEQRQSRSIRSAESGMSFIKHHLANLGIAANTPSDQLFYQVYLKLVSRLDSTVNMGTNVVYINGSQDTILVPSSSTGATDRWITSDADGAQFRCVITKQAAGQQLRVKVIGKFGNSTTSARGLQLDYGIAKDAAKIFNYGVASKSAISMSGNVSIKGTAGNDPMGSVLSATTSGVPLTMTGTAVISGDASFTNANASLSISPNATIAGFRPSQAGYSDHIHGGVPEVPFPTIDTSAFAPFVPPSSAPAGAQVIASTSNLSSVTTLKNVRIKAGANPTFNNDLVIQGIVYVEPGNKITFNGKVNMTGAIVVQTDGNSNETLPLANNTLLFAGSVSVLGVDMLPATSDFPPELRALKGSMLLAPGFSTTFTGNFGTVNGSIVSSQTSFSGSAGGTVKGSIVNMKDVAGGVSLGGTSNLVIESQGTSNYPAGVFFGSHYSPLPATYAEVTP